MPKKKPEKKEQEKPTPEQLKKVKKKPPKEKKERWPFPIESEEKEKKDTSSESPGGDIEVEEVFTEDSLKEICKGLAGTLCAIWIVFDKEIEALDEKEKDMLAEPMARCAKKHEIQKWMKDEFALALALAVVISKRLIKKHDKNDNRKTGTGKDDPNT